MSTRSKWNGWITTPELKIAYFSGSVNCDRPGWTYWHLFSAAESSEIRSSEVHIILCNMLGFSFCSSRAITKFFSGQPSRKCQAYCEHRKVWLAAFLTNSPSKLCAAPALNFYSLVASVRLAELMSPCGIWTPWSPDWPHCPYWMLMGLSAPKSGWGDEMTKSAFSGKLSLSLMGRPLRQSDPDHDEGSKTLMVSNLAFLLVVLYKLFDVEVRSSCKYKRHVRVWFMIIEQQQFHLQKCTRRWGGHKQNFLWYSDHDLNRSFFPTAPLLLKADLNNVKDFFLRKNPSQFII